MNAIQSNTLLQSHTDNTARSDLPGSVFPVTHQYLCSATSQSRSKDPPVLNSLFKIGDRRDAIGCRVWQLLAIVLLLNASHFCLADEGLQPPQLAAAKTTVRLPGPITDAVVGGGGRYLIFQFASLQQLAIFDVNQAKVLRYQPLPSNDVALAAGQSHLYIGLRPEKLIQRWNIASGELEVSTAAPVGGIGTLAMGAQSDSPLFLLSSRDAKRSWLIDTRTMRSNPFSWRGWSGGAWGPVWVNVSFDGSTAAACGGGWAGIDVLAIGTKQVTTTASGSYTRGETLVAGNGGLMFPDQGPILRRDLASEVDTIEGRPFPALDRTWSVALGKTGGQAELTVFANADPKRLVTLRDLPELNQGATLPNHKRIFLIPAAEVLVTVGPGSDHLILRRFDMAKALADEGIDFLFVTSAPVQITSRGKTWRYPVVVRSRQGGVKMTLQSAPDSMKIDAQGEIRWRVPRNAVSGQEVPVIVEISDQSGQVIFHTFRIFIQ